MWWCYEDSTCMDITEKRNALALTSFHSCSLGHNCYRSISSLCGRGIPAVTTIPCMFLTPHHNVQYKHTQSPPHTTHHTPTSHISIHTHTPSHIYHNTHHTHTTVRYTHTKSHSHTSTHKHQSKSQYHTYTPPTPLPPTHIPLGKGCTSSTSHSCISLLPSWLTSSTCSVASCL